MNSNKRQEDDLFLPHDLDANPRHHHIIDPSSFSLLFPSSSSDSPPSHSSDESPSTATTAVSAATTSKPLYISPDPHISSQFYTFNPNSHALMIRCLLRNRLATPAEIRTATPRAVLKLWRKVWKDRNEETAYLTACKRIQDKLTVHIDSSSGEHFLCFKNNSHQFVSHVNQWKDIVMSYHSNTDLKHLGLKETVDRIKQVWTVGAKFYGILESYIRVWRKRERRERGEKCLSRIWRWRD